MPIFNSNNNFQGSEQADLFGGDTLRGGSDHIVGGLINDTLLGNSTRIDRPDDTIAIPPDIIAITPGVIWFTGNPAKEVATPLSVSGELLSAHQQSLGTTEYLTNEQPIPFDVGSNLIGFSFEPPTVGESSFIF